LYFKGYLVVLILDPIPFYLMKFIIADLLR
jgi:hypothetical protein